MAKKKNTDMSSKAYDYIYTEIAANRLSPGTILSENAIAIELGISRSPVREALKTLEAEGIVTKNPKGGTYVTPITVQDIKELYELRAMLECYAAEVGKDNLLPEQLDVLEDMFLKLDENSSIEEYHHANELLHRTIVAASANRRLEKFYLVLNSQIMLINKMSVSVIQDFAESKVEHLAIIHALKEKNIDQIRKNIYDHINERKENSIRVFLQRERF